MPGRIQPKRLPALEDAALTAGLKDEYKPLGWPDLLIAVLVMLAFFVAWPIDWLWQRITRAVKLLLRTCDAAGTAALLAVCSVIELFDRTAFSCDD